MFYKVVLLIVLVITGSFCSAPTLEYSTPFPVQADSLFQITLTAKKEYNHFSVMRIEILSDDIIVSKVPIYPGFSDQLDVKITNKYFELDNWKKDYSDRLNIYLRLHEAAHGKFLCVFFQESKTKEEKLTALNKPCHKDALLNTKIELTIDPTLDLSIRTKDGRTDGVHQNDVAIISCVSRNGLPPVAPTLSHSSSILGKPPTVDKERNTVEQSFMASLTDHGKIVSCFAGRSVVSTAIHVFHNPTAVHLNPYLSSYFPNGSSVECVSSNGYPKPTVTWIFIHGPQGADKYYRISPSNNLTMLPDAPINSRWIFNCSSINSITTSYDAGVNKAYVFIIYPINHTMTIVVSVLLSIAGLMVIVIVLCCCKKKIIAACFKIIQSRSGTNKDAGDDAPNNFKSSGFYTYPDVAEAPNDSGIESESKKPSRKNRRIKSKRESDIYEEDNIV